MDICHTSIFVLMLRLSSLSVCMMILLPSHATDHPAGSNLQKGSAASAPSFASVQVLKSAMVQLLTIYSPSVSKLSGVMQCRASV